LSLLISLITVSTFSAAHSGGVKNSIVFLFITDKKEIIVNLNQGDMLIYKGNILNHWRNAFTGNDCAQVFLHYNNVNTKGALENIYDTRLHVGLPASFKKNG
jgi:hypothetical protein